jgi:beta-lactam-binding protein with PASTA domain
MYWCKLPSGIERGTASSGSSGKPGSAGRCTVPKLRGATAKKAKAKLKKAGCKAKVRRARSSRVRRGRVIKQSAKAGNGSTEGRP